MPMQVVCAPREKHQPNSGRSLAFRVDITETALGDAEEYVRFIREQGGEPEVAERWWRGLLDAIDSLEDRQNRLWCFESIMQPARRFVAKISWTEAGFTA